MNYPPTANSLFALQSLAFTPLLVPPFLDNDDLQSNACVAPRSAKPSSRQHKQKVGLGFMFDGPDSFHCTDSSLDNGLLGDPLLDSPRLFISNDASARPPDPAEALRPRFSPDPENDCRLDAHLSTSSSAFSIRDWIIHPSSSPLPEDPLCESSTLSHDIEAAPGAVSGPQDTVTDLHLLSVVPTAPETPSGINPAILTAPRIRSPLAGIDGFRGSMESVLLQVVEHLCSSHIPATSRLSPGQTLSSRSDLASPHGTEHAAAHSLELMCSGATSRRCPGNQFSTPVEAFREFTSANMLAVGSALVSPQNMLSSDSGEKCLLVSPDTPLFNVHEGVSEYDLQRRANRYRRRYPGRSLDRHWLLKYAGRLNRDGQAIENYRCYISGCAQVNKRRDHIIVHICSHVNERPFACRHWLPSLPICTEGEGLIASFAAI
jgi:hypothetical protein